MAVFRRRAVAGVLLPRRRFTRWAALYFLAFVCLPILAATLILDAVLYLVFTRLLDRCYGVLCFFG